MAASSSLTASAPHFYCPRRRCVTPLGPFNLGEARKYRASSEGYFQRVDQKASRTVIFGPTQFKCKAATMEVTLANETLLTGEEAVITAAAAEAVALARAAFEVAKEAVQLSKTTGPSTNPATQTLALESKLPLAEKLFENPFGGSTIQIEEKLASFVGDLEVTVGSTRQDERRARRQRVSEKVAGKVVPMKSRASKRRTKAISENDYKDPILMFKRIAGTYKILTAAEERELSNGVQDLLRLKKIEKELMEQNGQEPSFPMWAAAAQIDQRMLRRRLDYGTRCKEKMVRCNIRLVLSIARRYVNAGLAFEDLVQEGCRGLVRGVEKFDASKGFKFSTYAHWWIKQAIRKSLSETSRLIHLPSSMVYASYRVKQAIRELQSSGKKLKDLDPEEIAAVSGVSKKTVKSVLTLPKTPRSLELKIGTDQNIKLSDTIPCRKEDTPEYMMNKECMKLGLNKVLDTLTTREKLVVRWRYGLEDDGRGRTLQEVGDMIGISRERVRQIESCAIRKLKSKKRLDILQEYVRGYSF